MHRIFISIIIPVYNNVSYISKAIENYIAQSCSQAELIVVDGGSEDGTVEVIKHYASLNNSIRWISEKDNGQSQAMNRGIRLAQGKYISFLNVDDFYSPGVLNKVIQQLENRPGISFLVGNCHVWDQFGDLIYINRPSKTKVWHVLSGYHFPVNPTAYFYLKSIHTAVGEYNEENHFNMDLEFILKTRLFCSFTYVDEDWGNFRMLPNTKTFTEMEGDLLGIRKQKLLKKFQKEATMYIRLRVFMYQLERVYSPKISYFFRRIRDKIKFEFAKKLN